MDCSRFKQGVIVPIDSELIAMVDVDGNAISTRLLGLRCETGEGDTWQTVAHCTYIDEGILRGVNPLWSNYNLLPAGISIVIPIIPPGMIAERKSVLNEPENYRVVVQYQRDPVYHPDISFGDHRFAELLLGRIVGSRTSHAEYEKAYAEHLIKSIADLAPYSTLYFADGKTMSPETLHAWLLSEHEAGRFTTLDLVQLAMQVADEALYAQFVQGPADDSPPIYVGKPGERVLSVKFVVQGDRVNLLAGDRVLASIDSDMVKMVDLTGELIIGSDIVRQNLLYSPDRILTIVVDEEGNVVQAFLKATSSYNGDMVDMQAAALMSAAGDYLIALNYDEATQRLSGWDYEADRVRLEQLQYRIQAIPKEILGLSTQKIRDAWQTYYEKAKSDFDALIQIMRELDEREAELSGEKAARDSWLWVAGLALSLVSEPVDWILSAPDILNGDWLSGVFAVLPYVKGAMVKGLRGIRNWAELLDADNLARSLRKYFPDLPDWSGLLVPEHSPNINYGTAAVDPKKPKALEFSSNVGTGQSRPRRITFNNPRPLQHAFSGHAKDFGITANWSKASGESLKVALEQHISDSLTLQIIGTYRGTDSVIHYFNPQTLLWACTDLDGEFKAGWILSRDQGTYLLNSGNVQ